MRLPAVHQSITAAAKSARRAGAAVTDVVYPKRCAGCRERGAWVCPECRERLAGFAGPVCAGCGVPLVSSQCHCHGLALGLAAVRSVGPFEGWLHQAVLNFKYHDEWARADHLGRDLAVVVGQMANVDALVPVPLHHARLRERGYNQSALLAKIVGEQLALPVVDALVRTRPTTQQTLLSGMDRMANVDGAFALGGGFDPAGLNLVLIDDVITTGSTINACARVLAEHGATMVRAATLARQLSAT